ncbi:MAG: SDR family NAD(P)-dependent oxidoreductase [Chloroflexi bacterium]|nr:SDR family NAD(P)-dependent oxidoreductase [Chloroflexota bacterium]
MPVLPEYDLSGKTAILSTSGGSEAPFLGQALVEAGASVFAVARTQALLDAVLASLPSGSSGAVMDAGVSGSAASAMEQFDRSHAKVDILVNDHRSMYARPLEEISVDEWDAVQTRNAKAPFLLSQQVLPRMAKDEYGRVVNMISELAERGMINGSAFAASQAAVLSLTRSLAVEWSRFNIRINAIGTGLVDTEGQTLETQQEELVVRYTPLRRKGKPSDIGPLLVYLCSESCDYSTGQPVYVDGGLNAHP